MARAIILGGGTTGLACAYYLSKHTDCEVVLFEADEQFGGLARNFGDEGWRFEFGPHNIHSQDAGVVALLKEIFGNQLRPRNIRALLYIFDRQVQYPLKGIDTLTILRPEEMLFTSLDFLMARIRAFLHGIQETEHFDEWIIRRFGKKMFELYFAPYVRKVWKIDPHELSCCVGEKRIPILSIRKMIMKQLGLLQTRPHPEDIGLVKSFMPVYGSGKIMDFFKEDAIRSGARLVAGARVERIVVRGGAAVELRLRHTNPAEGAFIYELNRNDRIISTIPLTRLFETFSPVPGDIAQHANKIDYTGLVLLFLKIRGTPIFGKSWVYFSDPKIIFNRISEYCYDDLKMVPPAHISLCIEVPCNVGDEVWEMNTQALFGKVIRQLSHYKKIPEGSVAGCIMERVEYAYPRFRVHYDVHLTALLGYLLTLDNVTSIGRQGLFCYANIDQCMRMAFDLCEALTCGGARLKEVYRMIINKAHEKVDITV